MNGLTVKRKYFERLLRQNQPVPAETERLRNATAR